MHFSKYLCLSRPDNKLHLASRHGLLHHVCNTLKSGQAHVNQPCCSGGRTALFYAAEGGDRNVATFVLGYGADVNARGDDGLTALHISARCGHVEVVDLLIQAGGEVDAKDVTGYTPLMFATMSGGTKAMEMLISAGGAQVDLALPGGNTSLFLAAEKGIFQAVTVLLAHNANPLLETRHGFAPLHVAISAGHKGMVREMISCIKMEGWGESLSGIRALHLASQEGHVEIMQMLSSAGARDAEAAALCAAVSFGGEDAVKFLLENAHVYLTKEQDGTDIVYANHARKVDRASPLLYCLVSAWQPPVSVRILRRLLEAGASTSVTYLKKKPGGEVWQTPLEVLQDRIDGDELYGNNGGIVGMRRLLKQENAVQALSWGWPSVTAVTGTTVEEALGGPVTNQTLRPLPGMRRARGASKSRAFLRAALHRYINKEDHDPNCDTEAATTAVHTEAEACATPKQDKEEEEACEIAREVVNWMKRAC